MATLWVEYGYPLPSTWLHPWNSLPSPCQKRIENCQLKTVASRKSVNRNQPETSKKTAKFIIKLIGRDYAKQSQAVGEVLGACNQLGAADKAPGKASRKHAERRKKGRRCFRRFQESLKIISDIGKNNYFCIIKQSICKTVVR